MLVDDFGLIRQGKGDKGASAKCSRTAYDQLFVAVDSSNLRKQVDEQYNKKNLLNRQEVRLCGGGRGARADTRDGCALIHTSRRRACLCMVAPTAASLAS